MDEAPGVQPLKSPMTETDSRIRRPNGEVNRRLPTEMRAQLLVAPIVRAFRQQMKVESVRMASEIVVKVPLRPRPAAHSQNVSRQADRGQFDIFPRSIPKEAAAAQEIVHFE